MYARARSPARQNEEKHPFRRRSPRSISASPRLSSALSALFRSFSCTRGSSARLRPSRPRFVILLSPARPARGARFRTRAASREAARSLLEHRALRVDEMGESALAPTPASVPALDQRAQQHVSRRRPAAFPRVAHAVRELAREVRPVAVAPAAPRGESLAEDGVGVFGGRAVVPEEDPRPVRRPARAHRGAQKGADVRRADVPQRAG